MQTVLTAKTGCDIQNMYHALSFELLQVGTTKKNYTCHKYYSTDACDIQRSC